MELEVFDIADYEYHLTREVEKRDGFTDRWEVEKRTAFIKARHSRATRIPETLSDFLLRSGIRSSVLFTTNQLARGA